jgi:ketosteroid isomerase-like protein
MSSGQMVRMPLRVRRKTSRALDQRLFVRFPRLAAASFALVLKLPPGSRLRRAGVSRAIRLGLEAFNRKDLDVAVVGFHPDLEYYPYREFVAAGLAEPCYHGRSGYRAYIEGTYDVWGEDVRLEATELIDLGDRFVVLADMPMQAQSSGVALAESYGSVWTVKDGGIIQVRDFLRHSEALEAAGVPE